MPSKSKLIKPFAVRSAGFWNMVVIALAAILAFTPLRLVSFIATILLVARLLPFRGGLLSKIVLAYGAVISVNGFLAAIFWLAHKPLSSGILLVVMLGIVALGTWRLEPAKQKYRLIDWPDVFALTASIAAMLVLLWPLLFSANGPKLAQVVVAGGDNTAHLEMVKTNDLNRGFAFGSHNRSNPIPNAINYPQSWHFSVAFTKWLTEPLTSYSNSPTRILILFYGSAVAWFGMLIFLLVRLSFLVAEERGLRFTPAAALAAIAVITPFFTHWFITLFADGFEAQIAALVLLLMEAFVLILVYERQPAKRFPLLLLAGVFAVSINFVWLFLAPIALLPLGLMALHTMYQTKRWPPLYFVIGVVVLGLLALFQPIITKIFPTYYEFPLLLQRGLVTNTSMFTVLLLCSCVGLYTYLRRTAPTLQIGLYTGLALVFSLVLFKYQLRSIHELRYFYFKSTYTIFAFASVSLGAAAFTIVSRLQKEVTSLRIFGQLLTIFFIIFAGSIVTWTTRDPIVNAYGSGDVGGIDKAQAAIIITELRQRTSNGFHLNFIGSCDRGNDIRAGQLAHALVFAPTPPQDVAETAFDAGVASASKVFANARNTIDKSPEPAIVASSDQVISQRLMSYLGPAANKVKLVNLDTTPETESVLQCPNRIR